MHLRITCISQTIKVYFFNTSDCIFFCKVAVMNRPHGWPEIEHWLSHSRLKIGRQPPCNHGESVVDQSDYHLIDKSSHIANTLQSISQSAPKSEPSATCLFAIAQGTQLNRLLAGCVRVIFLYKSKVVKYLCHFLRSNFQI